MSKDIWNADELATQHFGHPEAAWIERSRRADALSAAMCRVFVFAGMVSAAVLAFSIDMMLLP